MIKKIIVLSVAMAMASCTLDLRHEHEGPYQPVSYVGYEAEFSYQGDYVCYQDPYWHAPQWCETYGNDYCCVWWLEEAYYDPYYGEYDYYGWYEEWCVWEDDSCWEYNGSF